MTETVKHGTRITVQGRHSERYPAERATIQLNVGFDGADRSEVFEHASHTASGLRSGITSLHNEKVGPVTRWSSNTVHVWGDRPWNSDGTQLPIVYHSNIKFSATFSDFDSLARFIETTAEMPGVSIEQLNWELSREHAETVSNEVRALAVQDAVTKATAYAHAVGLSSVTATAIADPGMLGEQASAGSGGYELASASRGFMKMDAGGSAQLSLSPDDIEVSAAVDARFIAS